ncbi:hypothetical protein [Streptomyces sp. NBC_00239]|uniref:hypothetical protein n=1 Tax=Streptomyces sp. NBC_00239 TaxID=2903640 RepID=UPI002E290EC4|nr:hypothetical protein [Streptomyces sp. NBC_00239]
MPDVEAVLAPWLEATLDVTAGAETPADLEQRLPFIRVQRTGGEDGRFGRNPRVEVDVFAASADEVRELSADVRDALLFLTGVVPGAVIRGVTCPSGPSRRPWANPAVHRRGATYSVSLRNA